MVTLLHDISLILALGMQEWLLLLILFLDGLTLLNLILKGQI